MTHVDTVVLGSGPSGLAAAYRLAQKGRRPIVVEAAPEPGGLMRSVKRGDFELDIGRKELYSRIPEVHAAWCELLGDDYKTYPRRIGVLYDNVVIEQSRAFKGVRRGMPLRLLAPAVVDFALQQLRAPLLGEPHDEEEFWYRTRGELFSRMLTQGFHEKFSGDRWREKPVPRDRAQGPKAVRGLKSLVGRAVVKDHGIDEWRHPAHSSGQIPRRAVEEIERHGGEVWCGAKISRVDVDGGRVRRVVVTDQKGERTLTPEHVVSSIPVAGLARLLGLDVAATSRPGAKKSTVITYVFVDEPPQFPHQWLLVTDPTLKVGRVVNYATFNGAMVPRGQTALAAEYFLVGDDPILTAPDDALRELALKELGGAGLMHPGRVFDVVTLRFPGAYASTNYKLWQDPEVQRLTREVRALSNVFEVNRAGTDVAFYCGLEAAESILSGDRARFDENADPAREYGIRSTRLGV